MPTTTGIDRHVPHNLEIEGALLGSILLDNGALTVALETITRDDFFTEGHRLIFDKMLDLADHNRTIDFLMLSEVLSREGLLERVGGAGYLAGLTDGVPIGSAARVTEYAHIIQEKSVLRSVIQNSNNLIARCLEGVDDSETILDLGFSQLFAIAERKGEGGGTTFFQAAGKLIQKITGKEEWAKIYTGIPKIDKLTGGFQPGELVVCTAYTGTGKSLFSQQVRRRACLDQRHGIYASAEMLDTQLVARELATQAGVDHWKMRRPERLQPDEMQRLINAAQHECQRCRILDGDISLRRIRYAARRRKTETGLHLVVVDYDELIDAPGKDSLEKQANLVHGLMSLAKEIPCVVLLVSQLRKSLKGMDWQSITLDDLYGSGTKPKGAHFVFFLHRGWVRDFSEEETQAHGVMMKARDGRQGKFDLRFNLKTLRFEDAEQPPEPDYRDFSEPSAPAADEDETFLI